MNVGLVTDYGSSMVQWMKNRGPVYKGPPKVEMERPSASYIVDVSLCFPNLFQLLLSLTDGTRCYLLQPFVTTPPKRYPRDTSILL
jgi:hypothetical protein